MTTLLEDQRAQHQKQQFPQVADLLQNLTTNKLEKQLAPPLAQKQQLPQVTEQQQQNLTSNKLVEQMAPPLVQKQQLPQVKKQKKKLPGKENIHVNAEEGVPAASKKNHNEQSKVSIGDVMLHKMKGFPMWPVKITSIEEGR